MQLLAFADTSFSYNYNVSLANNATWTACTHIINLDYNPIIVNIANVNTDIGYLTNVLNPINTNFPNTFNYNLSISANSSQLQSLMVNSINPAEKIVIMQTTFTSNLGTVQPGIDTYLKIKMTNIGSELLISNLVEIQPHMYFN